MNYRESKDYVADNKGKPMESWPHFPDPPHSERSCFRAGRRRAPVSRQLRIAACVTLIASKIEVRLIQPYNREHWTGVGRVKDVYLA